ncbi:uncharacterized protein LOC120332459 [Styela clava]
MIAKARGTVFLLLLVTLCYNVRGQCEGEDKSETGNAKNDTLTAILEVPDEEESNEFKKQRFVPRCGDDFLKHVLVGRWVHNSAFLRGGKKKKKAFMIDISKKKRQLDKDMKSVWRLRGIPEDPWKSTTNCGYYRLRESNVRRPPIGTWCDPKGPRPCCNNKLLGYCVSAQAGSCSCTNCADVRKLQHAELMTWLPYSYMCKWKQFTAPEACDVIEHSPVKKLYIVGDSYMQSMYIGLLMILTGKPITGFWKKGVISTEQYVKCANYGLNYFKDCRAMIETMDDMKYRNSLCGDGRNVTFKAEFRKYYHSRFGPQFRKLIKRLAGKRGTYVVVGIGFHIRMEIDLAIRHFMAPAIREVSLHYKHKQHIPQSRRWPRFLFSLPMDYGLLKPTRHLKEQYHTKQTKFERGMRSYCRRNSIRVLDFTPLTKNVHTFDGVHYGIGVNNMKNQIFLNYLATLKQYK